MATDGPEKPKPPRKAWRIEIFADGHSYEEMKLNLEYLLSHMADEQCTSLVTSSGWLLIENQPKSKEQYFEELESYLRDTRKAVT